MKFGVFGMIVVNSFLYFVSIVSDQTLNWPGCGITQSTDCVAFDLFCQLPQHIDFCIISFSDLHSFQNICKPWSTFSAWCALTTTFVLIEFWKSQNGFDDISLLVHNDNGGSSQTTFEFSQSVEVHQNIFAEFFGQESDWRSTWNDGFQVVPSSDDTSTVSVNELSQWDWHFLFNGARIVDVTWNAEKFCSSVIWSSERWEPWSSSSHDCWANCDGFDVGDGSWTVEYTAVGWEWWFQSGLTDFSFQTFNQTSLLSANIGTGATVDVYVKIIARATGVFTQESLLVGLILQ